MKKYLLLTVMCVLGLFGTLRAQETSFSYDFNDGTLTGWNTIDADGDGFGWELAPPSNNYSGVDDTYGVVSMTYRGVLTPDNYLVTASKYAITATSKLTFNHMNADYSFPLEGVGVGVSENGTDFEMVWSYKYTTGAMAWNEDVVDLSAYAGKELYIAIRHYDCDGNGGTGLKVDNIVLTSDGGSEGGSEGGEDIEPTPGETQLITLGSGDMSSPQIPFNTWYNYAISQQIYTAEELAAAGLTEGTIKSIGFKSAHTQTADRNVKIYMLNTDKAYFTTDNNTSAPMEAVTADNLVYDGTMNIVAKDEWFSAEFTTPFEYTGSNILVYFVDYTQSYTASECLFYTYATENYTALYDRQDNEEYLPYDSHNGLVLNYKNQVQFGIASDNTTPGDAATTFAFNFDDGTFTGWRTFDAPDAYCFGWQISPDDAVLGTFYQGTDGTDCAVSVSANPLTGDLYKPDSYLVTEEAYLITATSKLSWNMKTPFATSAEYYEVVVSSDNNTFTAIWSEEKNNVNNLTAKEVSLAEYAGQTLYIGFRHYRETSNANAGFLCIDDVVLSSEDGGEVEPQAPAAPANLVAEAAGTNSIVLTWDAVEGATTYKVYDEYDVIATTEETTYTVEGLAAATNYCFVVTAANEVGESFASAQACATTAEEQQGGSTAQTFIVGEDGATTSVDLPSQFYYNYAISQQIYTAADMNNTVGDITKVAFYQLGDQTYEYVRNWSVYMVNTDKEVFEGEQGWATVTNADLVFEGTVTSPGKDQWLEVELQTPFSYAGSNLLLCVVDNTGQFNANLPFKTFDVELEGDNVGVSICNYNDNYPYELDNLSWGILDNSRNTVQFSIISEPGLSVLPKDGINLGTIQLGNFWPEKAEASVNVSVSAVERTVESITCDNDFFVLSEIDLTAAPIKFTVGYDKTAGAGTYNGTLTVTAVEGDVVELPMTAVIYNAVEPDVFELAREISFTNDAYSDTPDFTTLYDDYVLPNEGENGLAPDAVYTFSLEGDKIIKAEVGGEGGFYAIYRADSIGEGKGPQANNNYNGTETVLSTTFEYNFDDNSLDAFTMINYDEYPEHCWVIEDGVLVSYSYKGWYDEDGNYVWMSDADERLIMNTAYTITPNSVLTFDIAKDQYAWENIIIEVTQDGENFFELGTVYRNDYDEGWTEGRVDVGSAFIAEGLAYGDYRIVLHHDVQGAGRLNIDNLKLTERAGVYEAGDYYLVAAAKAAFTLNVELQNVGGEPIDPEVKDYRIASIEGVTYTEYTYESENSNKVVEISSDGLIDVLEYNADGTLAGYTTTVDGTDEVITEVEYIYENGKLAGYSEVAQGWTGPITEDATFVYNAEGQITEIVSSKMTTQLTYNAEGQVTEKLVLYGEDIDSKEVYEYENGRLIRNSYYGYDSWETMDFYLGEVYEYEYDVNGNYIKENQYLVNDDESWTLFYVNEISHNMTVAYEDVFYFEYPHLAILNPAKPSHNNIITREFSYYQYEDNGEFVQHSEVETIYNYNPELPADGPTVPAPTNLVAEALSETEIKLTWDSEEVDGFTIYQNGEIVGLGLTVTEYTVTGLTAGTEYCFTVTAVIGDEESAHSNEACATTNNAQQGIGAPTNITAVATGANSILLSWDAVEGAAGYGIYLDGEWLAGFYNTVLEYEFVGYFDPETTYCFTMTTITEIDAEGYIAGETEPSDEVCATTEASSVLPPTNIVAEAISDTEIRLSWDAADGALGYGIYMDGQFAGAIQETSIVFDQLAPDTEYCFAVFSVSEIDAEGYIVGFSATSDEVCATTKGIGVEEFSTAFNIYPNPVNDVLFIENGNNIEEVSIYTITGVMVYSEQCVSNNVQVNVSELEGGVYIIKVRTENNEIINRFVKK